MLPQIWRHLRGSQERNGKQRRTKISFGRTMMRALKLQQLAKRHISERSNVEQWRNQAHIALVVVELATLVWRHQIVSQSVENLLNKFLKFHNNSTWLCLTNAVMLSESKYLADFLMEFWARSPKPCWCLFIVLPYYMIYAFASCSNIHQSPLWI